MAKKVSTKVEKAVKKNSPKIIKKDSKKKKRARKPKQDNKTHQNPGKIKIKLPKEKGRP